MSDSRLKYIVEPSFDQREFESLICKQQSIGDLKVVKDKLQDSSDILGTQLSQLIHKHLPLFLAAVDEVLRQFEGVSSEAEHYRSIEQFTEAYRISVQDNRLKTNVDGPIKRLKEMLTKTENTQRAMDTVKKAALFLGHMQKLRALIEKNLTILDPVKTAVILKDISIETREE